MMLPLESLCRIPTSKFASVGFIASMALARHLIARVMASLRVHSRL